MVDVSDVEHSIPATGFMGHGVLVTVSVWSRGLLGLLAVALGDCSQILL